MDFASFFNAVKPAYEIEQSLRFNSADNAYLQESSIGVTTTCTISWWHKKAAGSTSNTHWYIGSYPSGWTFESTDTASNGWTCLNGGGSLPGPSGSKYRDYSAWYHWVFTQNGTTSTMWLNGVKVKEDTSNSGSSKTGWRIGEDSSGSNNLNGYMAEFIFLDGTAVSDPDGVLGEFDGSGVWRPIEYTGGNYGTDGFYLKFDPSATNGIGHDHSGNGNNFTASGFTTSGTGTDVMSDTPTKNWCTLNPLGFNQQTRHTLSEGNLKYNQSASTGNAATMNSQGTIGVSSGKWYWEISDSENSVYGFMQSQQEAGNYQTTGGWVYYQGADNYGGVTGFSHSNGISTTDVIGMALDMDNKTCACYKNNTLMGTFTTIPDGTYFPTASVYSSSTSGRGTYNFGQRAFTYTPPSGFKPLNSANLPTPTVKGASKYFDTALWTNTTDVSSLSFQPDLVWVKGRYTSDPCLTDVVRGVDAILVSSDTGNEATRDASWRSSYGQISSFDNDGFTISTGSDAANSAFNRTNNNQLAWNWKAGGSVSADNNTDGTITSTVSASPTSGFSIVGWNGTGSNGTVGHGLNVAPSVVIVKNRDDNTKGWPFQFTELGNNYLEINNGSNTFTGSTYFQNTAPTSTVFSVGSIGSTNASGNKMIAYCFAEVDGFFKVGTYNGNNSNMFIYCGFKPALIVIKSSSTSNRRWEVFDSAINTKNPANERISWSQTSIATDYSTPDILSNGFALRGAAGYTNDSGESYIWMAWAESPFGGDGVSPTTAR